MRTTICWFMVFCFFFILFVPSKPAQALPVPGKSELSYQLYYYWDLRDRDSYVQVSYNKFQAFTSSPPPAVNLDLHIQIFVTNSFCNEFDFFDEYTPEDTHIYNLRNIQTNDGNPSGIVLSDNTFGFVVVTVMDASGEADDSQPFLAGNFRIVDNDGYEYRSVAASYPVIDTTTSVNDFLINYRTIDTSTFADVVGIAVTNAGAGFEFVQAGVGTVANFNLAIFNTDEVPISCSPETFVCASNVGLDGELPNSKGLAASLCPFTFFPEGFVSMSLDTASSTADFFVGFIGINNGGNRGGMEIFTALP